MLNVVKIVGIPHHGLVLGISRPKKKKKNSIKVERQKHM